MSYFTIADTTVTRTREDGTTRSFEFLLKEFDAIEAEALLPIVGEVVVQDGGQNDSLFKGFSSGSVTLKIKDVGSLPDRIKDAAYRQFQLVINETEAGETIFDGFVLPDFAEYTIFNDVKTLEFTASGAIKEMQNDPVEDAFRTWREIYTEATTSSGITRDVDFITRIREQSQGPAELVPTLLRANEADLVNTTEANRFEAIKQMNQQFNWRLVQHNGRWVVVDLYEMWKNPQAVRRFIDEGDGSYSIASEDHLVTLDQDNSNRYPTGRGEEAIGRIVMQRELVERADWGIQTISNQVLTFPPVDTIATVSRQSGKAFAGDKVDIIRFFVELTAEDTISTGAIEGTLKCAKITFTSELDNTVLYFDYDTGEWVDTETFGEVQFALNPGQSDTFNFGTDLPPVPENQMGVITIEARLDITFTTGVEDDIKQMTVKEMRTVDTLLPKDEIPVLYHQHSVLSQSGAGKTQVYPMWQSDTDSHATGQFMQFFETLSPWSPIILWKDEYTGSNLKLAEISARRKAEMTIGKRKSIDVLVRDTQGVDMLSVIDFDDGNTTHRCLPVHIKRSLFSGFVEVRMVPMTDASYTYESGYSFTEIEESDSKVGTLQNQRPSPNTYLTGGFFNTLLSRALEMRFDIKTTSALSGTITAVPVSDSVNVVDGETITVIDGTTLNRRDFTADGDQEDVTSISVNEQRVVGSLGNESYVLIGTENLRSGFLQNKRGIGLFSQGIAVGKLLSSVSGPTTELNIELFTQVTEGMALNMNVDGDDEPYQVIIDRESSYTDDKKQRFDLGKYSALPILEQNFETQAKAGDYLYLDGQQLLAMLHVTPSEIVQSVSREKTGESIGRLSQDLSGTVSSISLKDIDGSIVVNEGTEYMLVNRFGQTETVTSATQTLLQDGNSSLSIEQKTLQYEYSKDYAWLKEPNYKVSSRISLQDGRLILKVDGDGYVTEQRFDETPDGQGRIAFRADQVKFNVSNMNINDLVYIGKDLAQLKADQKQILIGLNDPDRPFVHVRTDDDNYVEMVARPTGDSDPFFKVISNGKEVFKVDRDGAFDIESAVMSEMKYKQSYESPAGPVSLTDYVVSGKAALMIGPSGGTVRIGGFEALNTGAVLPIVNRGDADLVLEHQEATSQSANRIITPSGSDYTISPNHSATLIYDGTDSRWRFLSTT